MKIGRALKITRASVTPGWLLLLMSRFLLSVDCLCIVFYFLNLNFLGHVKYIFKNFFKKANRKLEVFLSQKFSNF
jgi:hypothetical protein